MQYKMIEEWLKVKENQELFYQYLDEWESQNPQYFHSPKHGFEKIKQNLSAAKVKQAFETIEDKIQ